MIRATEKTEQAYVDREYFLRLDDSEIWTGSHLNQLRVAINNWRDLHEDGALTIDLSTVKHVPSGFFGLLCDLRDDDIRVDLYEAHEQIQNLIWFQRFFRQGRRDTHRFRDKPHYMTQ